MDYHHVQISSEAPKMETPPSPPGVNDKVVAPSIPSINSGSPLVPPTICSDFRNYIPPPLVPPGTACQNYYRYASPPPPPPLPQMRLGVGISGTSSGAIAAGRVPITSAYFTSTTGAIPTDRQSQLGAQLKQSTYNYTYSRSSVSMASGIRPSISTAHSMPYERSSFSYSDYDYSDYKQEGYNEYSYGSIYKSAAAESYGHPSSMYSKKASKRTYYSCSRGGATYRGGGEKYGRPRSYATPSEVERPHSSLSHKEKLSTDRPRHKPETERDRLLKSWRSNYCETPEDIAKKLAELMELDEQTRKIWVRSSPADLFYERTTRSASEVIATARLDALCKLFEEELLQRAERVRQTLPTFEPPARKARRRLCKHKSEACSSSSSDDSSGDEFKIEQDCCMEELSRKLQHPYRIHADLWHNDPGEMNDGPLCRCSAKSRRTGIRHGIYPGETGYPKCMFNSNNSDKLHHYRITISPPTNFLTKTPTIIKHDEHEFIFEGFSLLSHMPLGDLPTCKVIRFNIEYTIQYLEEKLPENFTVRELELFGKYLFHELLELMDFSLYPFAINPEQTCPAFHFMPRFVRDLPDNGKEVLAMCEVLKYLLDNSAPLVDQESLRNLKMISQYDWQDYVDFIKGMLVTKPGYKPCSLRVDQLDRNVTDLPECVDKESGITHPAIVHFGIRPPQLSYAGNPDYQKAWREYVKFRHLIANMSKPSFKDKRKLEEKEVRLQEMRTQGRMKRNVTVAISSKGFYRTGIMCDIVQHALLIPVLTGHLRFHRSLNLLEKTIEYKFKNRYLLQLALTHPSYKENYGTNPDHARNSLTNCGIRQPEYGDRKIHYMNTRKRGINTLINIMSRFGKEYETMSNITHNERLEFLGDAVVEFLSSIHLFFMFPDLEEGGLATYRAAIVQNQHLAMLAKKLHLEEYMLYAHGSDLCHELELRHAMANCFEALMGALLLDGGINVADNVFMNALFKDDEQMIQIWKNYPEHPLQEQEPLGDRSCISSYPVLQELTKFEDSIGIKFKHIRLLARAFTDRSIGFTHLTLGSNQRLEFLGDTVLQLICSEYLYRHFPEHHEGHLSLLRSSLVNNRTQAVVCDDLGMTKYAVYSNPKAELKTKDRADLLEAFLGALYVDKGLLYCEQFCHVCLFPRLQMFIMNQDWNDPKSKLQQCCLTLRTMDGGEPDIPIYKVIESIGPTNTRVYTVAVYFRSKRLATATGSSIQQAEMNAAKQALENSRELFPQLDHQKRVIVKSIKKQVGTEFKPELEKLLKDQNKPKSVAPMEDDSHLPKQYRIREDISSDELPENSDDDSNHHSRPSRHSNSSTHIHTDTGTDIDADSQVSRSSGGSTSSCSFDSGSGEGAPKRKRARKQRKNRNTTSSRRTQANLKQSPQKICEDVSSEECFDDATEVKTLVGSVREKQTERDDQLDKSAGLSDLKDLIEDVSSNSELD